MTLRLLMLSLMCGISALTMGCGDGHDDHCSSPDEAICSGTQIQHCDGEHYGEPESCDEGHGCMTMESGLTHCMPMGDDDHDGMDMGGT